MTNQDSVSKGSHKEKPRCQKNPYEQFAGGRLIMRDVLAIDRTVLANERTLLAYARTSLALILTGAAGMKFFSGLSSRAVGSGLIFLGLAVGVLGAWRSASMARRIRAAETTPSSDASPAEGGDPGKATRHPDSSGIEQEAERRNTRGL